jgi:type III pantothenate kinase
MLLLIDIGNSSTTLGLYDGGMKEVSRVRTDRDGRDEEEYALLLKGFLDSRQVFLPMGVVISSVVPGVTAVIGGAVRKNFRVKPLIVSHKVKTGLTLKVKYPSKLGTDRIATAVGARHLYRGDLIVIDFGTATTFSYVSSGCEYRPGPIMPGLGISADVLADRTAQLPRVDLMLPLKPMGGRTDDAIIAGLILGHAGGAERVVREMRKDSGTKTSVIATGGFAERIAPYMKMVRHVNPLLTLEGMRIIYSLNKRQ